MSNATIAVIVALLGVILFVTIFMLQSLKATRRAREAAAAAEPGAPAEKPVPAMSRRDFFRRSLITSVLVFGAEFGAGTIAFLWPNLRGGFGSVIAAGNLSELQAQADAEGFVYNGAGRFYLVPWNGQPGEGTANYPEEQVASDGLMPLYQRCVHLGCRVPFCNASKWFECPCHGSKYNGAGEYQLGPAPRGLDRFKITIEGDLVTVDTSEVVLGPPRGTNTIDQPPQGPFCVAAG